MYSGSRNPASTDSPRNTSLLHPTRSRSLSLRDRFFVLACWKKVFHAKGKEECSSAMQEWNLCSSFEVNLAMREERFSHVIGIVHNVKSTSDSIGVKGLYEVFVALQKTLAGEKGEEMPALEKRFTLLLRRPLQKIGRLED